MNCSNIKTGNCPYLTTMILFGLTLLSAHAEVPDRFQSLDKFVEECMAEYRIPGLALAVVEGDNVVYLKGYGIADSAGRRVTPQTPFFLGSVTKSFIAITALQLVETGRLDLDVPIKNYLPWFIMKDGVAGNHASERITMRHLLHHTSGIAQPTGQTALPVNDEKPDALERQVRSFSNVSLAHEPGNYYEYANANYQIAGLVVQVISGHCIEDVVKEQIFKPLKMTHSHTSPNTAHADGMAMGFRWWFGYPVAFTEQPFPRACFPSGYGISSAEDLSHYLIAQMNNGKYQGTAVLSPESMSIMHTPGMNDYAMGWYIGQDGTIDHGGHLECFAAHLYMDKKNQRGIALLANVNRGAGCGHLYRLTPTIAKLLAGEVVSVPPVDSGNRESLLQLLGVYIGIGVWLSWSLWKLRKWTKGTNRNLQGWRLWFFLTLPPVFEGLLVAALIILVPTYISVAFLHSPDAMWLWLFAIIITAGWSLLRTLWAVGLVIRERCPVKQK